MYDIVAVLVTPEGHAVVEKEHSRGFDIENLPENDPRDNFFIFVETACGVKAPLQWRDRDSAGWRMSVCQCPGDVTRQRGQ